MKTVVFDFETTSHNKGNPFDDSNVPVCIALLIAEENVKPRIEWFHFHDSGGRSCREGTLKSELSEKGNLLVGHNIKFDLHWLNRLGWEHSANYWDTMFPAHIAREGDRSISIALESLVPNKLKMGTKLLRAGVSPIDWPPSWVIRYCVQDVIETYNLYLRQQDVP